MSTIAQLVADITTTPAPVVFLDTCAVLDVARAPARSQADAVPAADTLVRLAGQSPPAVYLLVADIGATEWNDNIRSAREEATRAIATYEQVAQVSVTTGIATHLTPPLDRVHFLARLEDSSRILLGACRGIDRDAGAANEALNRVVSKRRPSHKKEVKDSYILEHCLAFAHRLGGAGFTKWLLFVSSNTKDFADPGSPDVHPDLASDFGTAGLRYAGTIAIAVAQLRAAGQIPP